MRCAAVQYRSRHGHRYAWPSGRSSHDVTQVITFVDFKLSMKALSRDCRRFLLDLIE